MKTTRTRSPGRFLAPAVWTAVVLSATAAVWAPSDTDPGLSPWSLTVSDFAALDRGGPIETTMAVLGIASLALLVVARARLASVRGLPSVLLAVWGVGLVVAAVVPTDPLVAHVGGPALVHRYASIAAFVALPAAGLLLARRFEADDHARGTARWLRALACAALAGAVLMAYSAGPGGRELIGLVERLLLGCEVVLLGLLGRYVHRCPTAVGAACGLPATVFYAPPMNSNDSGSAAAAPPEAYLPLIDDLAGQPFPEAVFQDATGDGGPEHLIRVLHRSRDFWDAEDMDVWEQVDAELGACRDALLAAYTARWGDPLVIDLWAGHEDMPEPFCTLGAVTTSLHAWPLPGGERWLGLAIGQADKELPMELLAAVGLRTALDAVRDGAPGDGA
ncbi:DUF998 domain-containing protein [Streptomyces sp. NPDC004436]